MAARYATYPSLAGKVAIITGGASGIGAAMALRFAEQGTAVHVLDIDEETADALIESARATEGITTVPSFRRCDVTDVAALQANIRDIAEHAGGLDILVANAADDTRHGLDAVTPEQWDEGFAVNLRHQFFAAQAARQAMVRRGGGAILCLGSISWRNKTTGAVAYTTAKSAIHGLVRALARELGPDGIRVNALVPGWTMTERQRRLWVDAEAEAWIDREQCLPGRVMPDDVARMALFLAADDGAMCTQQSFVVDGGWI